MTDNPQAPKTYQEEPERTGEVGFIIDMILRESESGYFPLWLPVPEKRETTKDAESSHSNQRNALLRERNSRR